jgi:hypothetical protein
MYTLQRDEIFYLATIHTVGSHNDYQQDTWEGRVRFLYPLPEGAYEVRDIWNDTDAGRMTPAELAAGFDAGHYENKQMKVFRIAPARLGSPASD